MQDKQGVPAEEIPPSKDAFAFRKLKQPKKDKSGSKSEGVLFKAKLIGVESVPDARGDKMCQEAMLKLKMNVKSSGTHKRKINICVSLQGIQIKDEKTGALVYQHPVNLISFISQDITDARAFGYVFGSTPHQFLAIKTDKPAFHVVLALRDLFQTVLSRKQETIDADKVKDCSAEEMTAKEENIYFEVLMTEPLVVPSVDHLLGLEDEMNHLKQGLTSMESSIAAAAAFNDAVPPPSEADPFDTSFVLTHKRDSFGPLPVPTPVPGDKYAVFNAIDASGPSIFEAPVDQVDNKPEDPVTPLKSVPPPKPPRGSSVDLSLFADLDPLGKDRPYRDKTEFFADVKNPPKKVLNDLVEKEPSAPFPVDFDSPSVHPLSSPIPIPLKQSPLSVECSPTTDYYTMSEGSSPQLPKGVSRPRPRSTSKSSQSLSSDSSSDYEAISRESMHSIARMLDAKRFGQHPFPPPECV